MQSGLISFALLVVLACWIIVVGHRLGVDEFDPAKYSIMNGTLTIAYTVVAMSVCAVAVLIVSAVIKR